VLIAWRERPGGNQHAAQVREDRGLFQVVEFGVVSGRPPAGMPASTCATISLASSAMPFRAGRWPPELL
jgi:hypothetical protein